MELYLAVRFVAEYYIFDCEVCCEYGVGNELSYQIPLSNNEKYYAI